MELAQCLLAAAHEGVVVDRKRVRRYSADESFTRPTRTPSWKPRHCRGLKNEYNTIRPHGSLGRPTPTQLRQQ